MFICLRECVCMFCFVHDVLAAQIALCCVSLMAGRTKSATIMGWPAVMD